LFHFLKKDPELEKIKEENKAIMKQLEELDILLF
jgi:hypothetical protein